MVKLIVFALAIKEHFKINTVKSYYTTAPKTKTLGIPQKDVHNRDFVVYSKFIYVVSLTSSLLLFIPYTCCFRYYLTLTKNLMIKLSLQASELKDSPISDFLVLSLEMSFFHHTLLLFLVKKGESGGLIMFSLHATPLSAVLSSPNHL